MDLIDIKGFAELSQSALETYAHRRARELDLRVADEYLPDVLETLAALQAHAATLAAHLQHDPRQSSGS